MKFSECALSNRKRATGLPVALHTYDPNRNIIKY